MYDYIFKYSISGKRELTNEETVEIDKIVRETLRKECYKKWGDTFEV